jgi:5-methylcytosine-specific restriction protein A
MPTRLPRHHPLGLTPDEASRRRNREHDRKRTEQQPWRRWYWMARWRRIAKAQLAAEPLCAMCLAQQLVTPATVCDHVDKHNGDPELFWHGKRQSLCATHHNSAKQREEHGRGQAVGVDGWPA